MNRLEEWYQQQMQESPWMERRRVEMSDKEVIEVALVMLAYIFEGDTEAYARRLAEGEGVSIEDARETAGTLGALLEMRRASAPDPSRPV